MATGTKNALLSSSAVVMPRPTMSSWLGESQLEPWVRLIFSSARMHFVQHTHTRSHARAHVRACAHALRSTHTHTHTQVHYIPVRQDFTDLEDAVEWCLAHKAKCKDIGRAGQRWMASFGNPRVRPETKVQLLSKYNTWESALAFEPQLTRIRHDFDHEMFQTTQARARMKECATFPTSKQPLYQ